MKELKYALAIGEAEMKTSLPNGLNALEKIKEKVEEIVAFFTDEDTQQGARLYFEMRLQTMLAPFTNLFHLIHENTTSPQVVNQQIKDYLSEHSALHLDGLLRMLKDTLPHKTNELETIFGQLAHFAILMREFTYLYGTTSDYEQEFGDYPYRTNIIDFYKKGNVIALNVIHFLASEVGTSTREEAEKLADFYIRETIFNQYRLSKIEGYKDRLLAHKIAYRKIKNKLEYLANLAVQAIPVFDELSNAELDHLPLAQKLRTYYQIKADSNQLDLEEINRILNKTKHRSIGFELEFNSGAGTKDLEEIARKYQTSLGWKKLYIAPHEDMYDLESDGLLYYDATLPQRYDAQNNIVGCALEYSAPPFTFKKDQDKYTALLNLLQTEEDTMLYTNSETHQHVYAQDIDLAGMKRLVLRRAWYDPAILEAFHVAGKRHDFNRSACALLTNISSYTTEQERKRNYIIFSGLVNSAINQTMLKQRVNRGNCKYNTLNLIPKETVEFRGMQGTFDKDFLEYYLTFNLFFVEAAAQNSATHFLPQALEQARKLRGQDQSPVLYSERMNYHKEAFDPTKPLTLQERQYLLNYDKHVAAESMKTGTSLKSDFLNKGNHRAFQNITLN